MTRRGIFIYRDGAAGIAACSFCMGTGRKPTAATTINDPCAACHGTGTIGFGGFNFRPRDANGEIGRESKE